MPDYNQNKNMINPNSNLDGFFGSSNSKPSAPQLNFKDNSVSEYLRLRALNAPVGPAQEYAKKEYSDYLANVQSSAAAPAAAPTVANPLAPATSTATKATPPATPTPATPATTAAATTTPATTPAATTPASTPASSADSTPSANPCDDVLKDIETANNLRVKLESEMGPSHVNGQYKAPSDQQHSMMGFVNSMLINAHKRMIDCNKLREKERQAPIEKARKEKLAAKVKAVAFQANAKAYGENQANDVAQKAGALLSMGKISPEDYQKMTADPSTYADTVNRMSSQNFNMDTNSPNEGGNETIGYQAPPAQVPINPTPAPYGQQNSGRYDRFKAQPAFTPPPQPQQPNKPPYGYPNYSAYG